MINFTLSSACQIIAKACECSPGSGVHVGVVTISNKLLIPRDKRKNKVNTQHWPRRPFHREEKREQSGSRSRTME